MTRLLTAAELVARVHRPSDGRDVLLVSALQELAGSEIPECGNGDRADSAYDNLDHAIITFHTTGREGVSLDARPTFQADVKEPSLMPGSVQRGRDLSKLLRPSYEIVWSHLLSPAHRMKSYGAEFRRCSQIVADLRTLTQTSGLSISSVRSTEGGVDGHSWPRAEAKRSAGPPE